LLAEVTHTLLIGTDLDSNKQTRLVSLEDAARSLLAENPASKQRNYDQVRRNLNVIT